jgi:hypothetical protein
VKLVVAPLVALLLVMVAPARADEPLGAAAILGAPRPFTIESVTTRYTHYDQDGHGYQSQAGPLTFPRIMAGMPGSEFVEVEQAQIEVIARQGDDIVHRLWIPLDIVSAASPDALDAVSAASRHVESGTVQLASSWQATRNNNITITGGFHLEPQFRSWNMGAAWARSLADDNATVALSIAEVYDWFDQFDTEGDRNGRVSRSSTNANLGLTQLLSPTTVAHVDYGYTIQVGRLGNTWNAVPLSIGGVGGEYLPRIRQRHALMGRLAQALPWHGALHVSYRFYADDWGAVAHTVEGILQQRLSRWLYVGATYRLHQQSGVSFYTQLASPTVPLRTADSDLAPFFAHTVGGMFALEVPLRRLRTLHIDFSYEHYWRTNDLAVNVYSAGLGLRL